MVGEVSGWVSEIKSCRGTLDLNDSSLKDDDKGIFKTLAGIKSDMHSMHRLIPFILDLLIGVKCLTVYYYCNRSGYFSTKGFEGWIMTRQGTNKLYTYCTASIVTVTDINTGKLTATIIMPHTIWT